MMESLTLVNVAFKLKNHGHVVPGSVEFNFCAIAAYKTNVIRKWQLQNEMQLLRDNTPHYHPTSHRNAGNAELVLLIHPSL